MPEIDLRMLNGRLNFNKYNIFFSNREQSYNAAATNKMIVKKGDEIFLLCGQDGYSKGNFVYGEGKFSDEVYNILKQGEPEPPDHLPNGHIPWDCEYDYEVRCEITENENRRAREFADRVANILSDLYPLI